jgi:hypothetical protein
MLNSNCTSTLGAVQPWLDALVSIVTIVGGAAVVWVYYRDHLRKKAEWMHQLYGKFFENAHFKKLRRTMDHKGITEEWLKTEANEEQLVDYLNFFEYIASLHTMGQISREEIERMFDYYLKLISERPVVRAYIEKWGFEDLDRLLREREKKDQRK